MLRTHADAQRRRLRRVGKTRQSASNVTAHRFGQDEAYFTVREILAEASTAADGVPWREPSDFCRCGFATLGFAMPTHLR